MTELKVLQVIRLKGRITEEMLIATVGEDDAAVGKEVRRQLAAGRVTGTNLLKLTDDGHARLAELLAAERAGINKDVIAVAYGEFREVNAALKSLISDWQLKDGTPNVHDDKDYDDGVLARLPEVHAKTRAILDRVATEVPRIADFQRKLSAAFDKVAGGDTSWLTRPLVDSYHTVWFELHEELIGAAGLTREQEANAGHAD